MSFNLLGSDHPTYRHFDTFRSKMIGRPIPDNHVHHATHHENKTEMEKYSSSLVLLKDNHGFIGMVKTFLRGAVAGGIFYIIHSKTAFNAEYFIEKQNYESLYNQNKLTYGRMMKF